MKNEVDKSVELPKDWHWVPLYELRNKADRYSFTGGPFGSDLKSEDYTEVGARVIQLQNIGEGVFLEKSKIYTSEAKADALISCNIYPNEIILAKMAPVARCCKIPASSGRYLMCSDGIRLSIDRIRFDNEFVYQALNTDYFRNEAESKSTGTTRARIGLSDLKIIPLAIPDNIDEQRKIAKILFTLDEKIAVIDKQLARTQELKKGLMQRLLTKGIRHAQFKDSPLGKIPASWENLTFNDLVKFSGGAQPPRSTFVFEPQEGYIRLIQTRDYRTDKYKTYIPEAFARKKCTKRDIMIGRYGPPIFQILRGLEGAYNVALIKAIPNESRILRDYLFYYISQYEVWAFIENLSQRGGGQTGVDLEELRKYPFPLPPIAEQHQIINILTTVDDKIGVLQDKKAQYHTLKKGLMQQLLTGQRRVRVTEKVPALV
jgi:type I restriction enzyme S subunit